MKITARGIGVCMSLLLGLALMLPVSAQSAAKPLKEQIVGHWQLVSVTIGERTPYGAAPQGSMFLDAGGHLSVIVISDGGAQEHFLFRHLHGRRCRQIDDHSRRRQQWRQRQRRAGATSNGWYNCRAMKWSLANKTPSGTPGVIKQTWKQAN